MVGSNNEVTVLEAVLGSLAKSPAFALLEAAHTEPSVDSVPTAPTPVPTAISSLAGANV